MCEFAPCVQDGVLSEFAPCVQEYYVLYYIKFHTCYTTLICLKFETCHEAKIVYLTAATPAYKWDSGRRTHSDGERPGGKESRHGAGRVAGAAQYGARGGEGGRDVDFADGRVRGSPKLGAYNRRGCRPDQKAREARRGRGRTGGGDTAPATGHPAKSRGDTVRGVHVRPVDFQTDEVAPCGLPFDSQRAPHCRVNDAGGVPRSDG